MGQGMIFIPDQCIGRMGIGMLHFPHTDILVPDQGRNGCRINGDPDSVQTQLISIHHMSDAPPDHRCMPRSLEPFIDFTFSGFSGGNQQIIGQQLRGFTGSFSQEYNACPLGITATQGSSYTGSTWNSSVL